MPNESAWALHQLTAFLAAVSSVTTAADAADAAAQWAAEALDAEVTAVLDAAGGGAVIGFPEDESRADLLRQIAEGGTSSAHLPHFGRGHVLAVPLDDPELRTLLVYRRGREWYSPQEHSVLRAFGRALGLALRLLRTLDDERLLRERSERQARDNAALAGELRTRQELLERLLDIQRAISRRAELQDVLDTITGAAARLLDADVVGLRLLDAHDRQWVTLVSSHGIGPQLLATARHTPADAGIGGQAIAEQRLVAVDDYGHADHALDDFVADRVHAAMAAPVYVNAAIAGSLVVATRGDGRGFDDDDQQMLRAFAEQASLALTDARTLEQIDQAFRDSLTGLPNRTLFLDRLEHALARHRREPFGLCVMFVDLDRFKYVNDSLGHGAGDALLTEVAQRVEGCLRQADTAARLGGDELAILLEDVSPEQAQATAERLLAALRVPVVLEQRELFVTASIGIAHTADVTPQAGELLRDADVAMYEAKKAGGDRYRSFEAGLHTAVLRRMELEGDLRRAVSNGELRLLYQPLVELATWRVVGVEALVRWDHPARGLVSPAEFIPVAEETGMIIDIGRWVLRTACRQAETWRHAVEGRPFHVSVNVSARQLQEPGFVADVVEALGDTRLPAQALLLEITETALMRDPASAASALQELKARGVRVAIDDFGSGYSSLNYLRQFPVDVMKIDRTFVNDLDEHHHALTDTMIGLAQNMRLNTVAEGIETHEQLERLLAVGCMFGQGFYFSRPLPAGDLAAVLASGDVGPGTSASAAPGAAPDGGSAPGAPPGDPGPDAGAGGSGAAATSRVSR